MLEKKINILSDEVLIDADAICFTSNGVIKKNGELVMGAGVAKAFKDKWQPLPIRAGHCVKVGGNKVHFLKEVYIDKDVYTTIVSFPTKNHWRNPSDMNLIKKSAKELMSLIEVHKWSKVYLPRPGIGFGGLNWNDVKAEIEGILDDRVTICYL